MIHKRRELSRLIRLWLSTNRHGRLSSDQWLNLVVEPLLPIVLLAVPLVVLMTRLPLLRMWGRYGRWVIPALVVAVVIMLLLRARRYAIIPVFHDVLYAGDKGYASRFPFFQQLTVFTERGEAVAFNRMLSPPGHLEPDMPYIVYYLQEDERRTLLSFAPAEHPDVARWQPTERFYQRQRKRGGTAS